MKFLVDAQLPRRLALWLEGQGCEAVHTLDLLKKNRTSDAELTRLADAQTRFVVTKDADFVSSFLLRREPRRLLLVSTGNLGNDALIDLFRRNWPELERMLSQAEFVELSSTALTLHS